LADTEEDAAPSEEEMTKAGKLAGKMSPDDVDDIEEAGGSNMGVILGLIAGAAVIGGGAYYAFCRKKEVEGGAVESKKLFKSAIKSKK